METAKGINSKEVLNLDVPLKQETMKHTIGLLEEKTKALEERLSVVLSPSAETSTNEAEPERQFIGCVLSSFLADMTARIDYVAFKLEGLIDRLQI